MNKEINSENLGKIIISDFKSSLKVNTDQLYNNQIINFKEIQDKAFTSFKKNIKEYNSKLNEKNYKMIINDLKNQLVILQETNHTNKESLQNLLLEIQNYTILFMMVNNNPTDYPIKTEEVNWEVDWELDDFLHKNALKKKDNDNCIIT
tara:strand:+ start:1647 stop:2093 length:447 start_codon:yes stop_codon:yes gene_type:complete